MAQQPAPSASTSKHLALGLNNNQHHSIDERPSGKERPAAVFNSNSTESLVVLAVTERDDNFIVGSPLVSENDQAQHVEGVIGVNKERNEAVLPRHHDPHHHQQQFQLDLTRPDGAEHAISANLGQDAQQTAVEPFSLQHLSEHQRNSGPMVEATDHPSSSPSPSTDQQCNNISPNEPILHFQVDASTESERPASSIGQAVVVNSDVVPSVAPSKSAAVQARGQSISLARRAAATAKKRRDAAKLHLERTGMKGVDVRDVIERTAATRANVSQNRSGGRRVARVKWTKSEVAALRQGVTRYGVGRWAVILREFADHFEPCRISVDLKDKWRNIYKTSRNAHEHRNPGDTAAIVNTSPTDSEPRPPPLTSPSAPPPPPPHTTPPPPILNVTQGVNDTQVAFHSYDGMAASDGQGDSVLSAEITERAPTSAVQYGSIT